MASHSQLLELQRTVGNQSVSALVSEMRGGGQSLQRAPTEGAVLDRPATAATAGGKTLSPTEQHHAAYAASFHRWWSAMPLEDRARWFVVFTSLGSRTDWHATIFLREVYAKSGVPITSENTSDFNATFPLIVNPFVRDTAPNQVERELLADPARGVAIWSDLLVKFNYKFEGNAALKDYSDRLQNSMFRAYASQGLETGKGKAPSKDKLTATQLLIEQVIVDHTQDYKIAGLAGVGQWALPYMDPSTMTEWLSGSSATVGAAGSIVGIWALEGGVLVAAGFTGIGLLAVGAALGIAAAINSAKDKEAAERQRVAEAGIKKSIISGFLDIASMIRKNEDVLALRLIGDARKEGQKISLDHRASVEVWVWKKLFGSFPHDERAGAQAVSDEIDKALGTRRP